MRKKRFRLVVSIAVLLLGFNTERAAPRGARVEATLEYNKGSVSITVDFSEQDLDRVKRDAKYVLSKLKDAGGECCSPRKKIGNCVWECCDGGQIKTCDTTLGKALDSLTGGGNNDVVVTANQIGPGTAPPVVTNLLTATFGG